MAHGKTLELAKLKSHPKVTLHPPAPTRRDRRSEEAALKKAGKIERRMQAEMDNYMSYPRKVPGQPRRFVRVA